MPGPMWAVNGSVLDRLSQRYINLFCFKGKKKKNPEKAKLNFSSKDPLLQSSSQPVSTGVPE